ncbi:Patatin phospholipase [uncultured virus]|nr:Patatin phospholipase [uncultured virus]
MYVLVLPVSGRGFVSQLAILQHLCGSKFVPDLTLSSSGGNVAAYVVAAANWKWPAIERISRELTQDLFARPWNSVSSLALIVGYFEGNVYNKGSGVYDFLSKYFTSETITKYEIWTGTYNKSRQKARLFCNRSKDDSIMDVSCIDHELTQSMEPVFTKGNIQTIAKAGIASASIPAIVPAEIIDSEPYIDGGIAGASPLTIMQEPILKYIKDKDAPLHIVYVNSVDLSSPNLKPCHNVLDTWRQATHDLVRSQTVIDRLSGYELLRCQPGSMHKEEFACNYANMERVKEIQSKIKYSMLEIYPIERCDIDIVSFNGEDVINAMRKAYSKCRCRLWWLAPTEWTSHCQNESSNIPDCSRCSICSGNILDSINNCSETDSINDQTIPACSRDICKLLKECKNCNISEPVIRVP